MRNSVFSTALLVMVLACGPAWAAAPATAPYNWTGFYAGLNTGMAINDSGYTLSPSGSFLTNPLYIPTNGLITDSGNLGNVAFTIGAQLGYNYQVGCFVYGLETDFNYDGTDNTSYVNRPLASPLSGNIVHTVQQKVDFFGTLRARFGYTPADRFLVYGTGGLAYGNVSSSSNVAFTSSGDNYSGSSSGLQAGWTLGAGSEYALTKCWSVKLEYLYIDLGSRSYTYAAQPRFGSSFTYTTDLDTTQHIVRVGLNYKF
ncbi:MAG: outer membrane protein [Syntrophobacteraceae bacterium]|jgi:outer membrane immunogenic protein